MDRPELEALIDRSDWKPVLVWAAGLSGEQFEVAQKWYRASLRARARRAADWTWQAPPRAIQLGLAIVLSSTVDEAVKNCRFGPTHAHADPEGALQYVATLLERQPAEFVRQFCAQAAAVPLRGESRRAASEIAAITLGAAVKDSSISLGGAIATGWAQLVAEASIASNPERLNDPNAPNWIPPRWTLVREDGELGVPAYGLPTTMREMLTAVPDPARPIAAALAEPDAFSEWNLLRAGPDWDVIATLQELIRTGDINRDDLIGWVLAALTRNEKPTAQRYLAKMLVGAGFGADDARPRTALVAHLLASAHGAVTAVLLPSYLEVENDQEALIEVGAVILARREKAQKTVLIDAMSHRTTESGPLAVLELAAVESDAAVAQRARKALPRSVPEVDGVGIPDWPVQWDLPVEGVQQKPFVGFEATLAGLDEARSDASTWVRITSDAGWLDLLTRFGHREVRGLRDALQAWPDGSVWEVGPAASIAFEWARGASMEAQPDVVRTESTKAYSIDPATGEAKPITFTRRVSAPGYVRFSTGLTHEVLRRLGEQDALVSTPSRSDGTIAIDDLYERLTRRRTPVGEYDMVQALLRLEATIPTEADRFRHLNIEVGDGPARRVKRKSGSIKAGRVVAEWIAAGGLPDRVFTPAGGSLRSDGVDLPLPEALRRLNGIGDLVGPIDPSDKEGGLHWGSNEMLHYLGTVPRWPDAASVLLYNKESAESIYRAKQASLLPYASGSFGDGFHFLVAALQSHARKDARMMTAQLIVDTARQGRLDRAALCAATEAAWQHGELSAARLADTWGHILNLGAVGTIWPAASATLIHAANEAKKPAGLADLLRVIKPIITSAPADLVSPELLEAIHSVADGKSKTKASLEADQILAIINRSRS